MFINDGTNSFGFNDLNNKNFGTFGAKSYKSPFLDFSKKINVPKIKSYSKINTPTSAMDEVYAQKWEPTYQKEMDLDDDGKITFEEFKQYCTDNNISDAQRASMLENWQKWQMIKHSQNYATKGDLKYKKEMDENQDGRVSYDEYSKYIEEQREKEKEAQEIKEAKRKEQSEKLNSTLNSQDNKKAKNENDNKNIQTAGDSSNDIKNKNESIEESSNIDFIKALKSYEKAERADNGEKDSKIEFDV